MGTVTAMRRTPRRLDNPESQLGRVYLVMRDAHNWMQLHEIGDSNNPNSCTTTIRPSRSGPSARLATDRHANQASSAVTAMAANTSGP